MSLGDYLKNKILKKSSPPPSTELTTGNSFMCFHLIHFFLCNKNLHTYFGKAQIACISRGSHKTRVYYKHSCEACFL